MKDVLDKIEAVRREAEQVIAEGMHNSHPIDLILLLVRHLIWRNGLPYPDDILAWVSSGAVTDKMLAHYLKTS